MFSPQGNINGLLQLQQGKTQSRKPRETQSNMQDIANRWVLISKWDIQGVTLWSPCIPPCVTLYPIFDTIFFIPEDLTTNRLAEVNQWKDKKFRSSEEEDCPKRSKSQVKLVTKGMTLVTKGANTFGSLLFKDLTKSQNLVFSPFSLSTGLAMLTPGAKGETLKQVKIHFQIRKHPFKKDRKPQLQRRVHTTYENLAPSTFVFR